MKNWIKITLAVLITGILLVGGGVGWAYYEFVYTVPMTAKEMEALDVDWTPATRGNWSPWVTNTDGTQSWNPAKSFNDWLATTPDDPGVLD